MSRSGYHAARSGPWRALFPGVCSVCSEPFGIGDMIARRKNQYMHVGCSPAGDEDE